MSGLIVHEWLAEHGGSEKVVEQMAATFPDARIHCLWDDDPNRFPDGRVTESWLARTPLRRHKSLALPFMPHAWRGLAGGEAAEWVLCSSHLFAHHASLEGASANTPKYVYAYTPARYIWTPELDNRGQSVPARIGSAALRPLDRKRAQEARSIASISEFVAQRIRDHWGRDSKVIFPPVDVQLFVTDSRNSLSDTEIEILASLPDTFVLGASRFIPYKRLDLVIRLGVAAGVPVVLAGDGPSSSALRALAAEHPGQVTFVVRPSQALLRELYRRALVYVFPPVEDFGIMPVEAMATGTPVVARTVGGASETVLDGVTGALFDSDEPSALLEAFGRAVGARPQDCENRAWEFDSALFRSQLSDWVGS